MKHLEGFIIGMALLTIASNVASGDWGDAADGVIMLSLFLAWSMEKRRSDRMAGELRDYRALVRDISAWRDSQ